MSAAPKNLREAAADMVLASDDGSEYEHNDGCQGEPDCPACWVEGIRRLFTDFPDEGAPVANPARVGEVLATVPFRDNAERLTYGPIARITDALLTAGLFRDEATVKAEAIAEMVATARRDAANALTSHGRCENESIADWLEDHAKAGAA